MNLFAIKLGGSAITNKEDKFSVRSDVLDNLAKELASLNEDFFIVHGGGSFGHPVASEYDISSGYSEKEQLMGFSETHRAMERLNSEVIGSLLKAGLPAVQMQTSACTVVDKGEIVSVETRNIEKLLELGIVPVLYGDSVPDLTWGMTIVSGDQLIARLAEELGVSKVVLGTDTDGIYTGDPKFEKNAEPIPKITPETWKKISKEVDFRPLADVTGGMKNKIEVLLNLSRSGIESRVVDATEWGNIKAAIRTDKKVGTKVTLR